VQWAMRDWPEEWKVPVIPKKVPMAKKKAEVGSSNNSSTPTTNTRKEIEHAREKGGSTTTRNPKQKNIIPNPSTQEKVGIVELNGEAQNDTSIPMSKEIRGGDLPNMDISKLQPHRQRCFQ
jgi:hypothetical protein